MRSVAGEVSIISNPINEDDLTLHIKPCFGQGQFVESGASRHATSDLRNLSIHSDYEEPDEIVLGGGLGLRNFKTLVQPL